MDVNPIDWLILDEFWILQRLDIKPPFACCAGQSSLLIFVGSFAQSSFVKPYCSTKIMERADVISDQV